MVLAGNFKWGLGNTKHDNLALTYLEIVIQWFTYVLNVKTIDQRCATVAIQFRLVVVCKGTNITPEILYECCEEVSYECVGRYHMNAVK